ncbi:MAG: type II secretion system F family protein [Chloroflexi bacterium]|nr:type II secretion system F family protein [Chloroflexota bacterium]
MDLSALLTLPMVMAFVFAASILVLFLGLDRVLAGRNEIIETRLDRYAGRAAPASAQAQKEGGRFDGLVDEKRGSSIATELARADLRLTPGEYVALNLGSIAFGAFLGLLVGGGISVSGFVFALLGALLGFYAPRLYVRIAQGRRLNAFNGQLGDTIVLLSNSLRSGYSLLQSMETAAKELSNPMSAELGRVTREIGLGLTIQEALANMYRRMPSDDLDLLITAINVQHEVGGNLAEILDNIAHTIRERIRIKGEIRTITAQQRLSGYLLSILPVILGFIMYLLNPEYISRMWKDTCGLIMLGTGAFMIFLGYLAIRKITNIEV